MTPTNVCKNCNAVLVKDYAKSNGAISYCPNLGCPLHHVDSKT